MFEFTDQTYTWHELVAEWTETERQWLQRGRILLQFISDVLHCELLLQAICESQVEWEEVEISSTRSETDLILTYYLLLGTLHVAGDMFWTWIEGQRLPGSIWSVPQLLSLAKYAYRAIAYQINMLVQSTVRMALKSNKNHQKKAWTLSVIMSRVVSRWNLFVA